MTPRPPKVSRREIVVAGWSEDRSVVRSALDLDDETLRATAVSALVRMGDLSIPDLMTALADASGRVRRRALGAVPGLWEATPGDRERLAAALLPRLADDDPVVLELACFVAGECLPAPAEIVSRLIEVCTGHDDALCRESATAALGSIGDPAGRDAVLAACTDKATVRRRAVLALAAFDGDEVDAMLSTMATDVDWQVRQAAEELLAIGHHLS